MEAVNHELVSNVLEALQQEARTEIELVKELSVLAPEESISEALRYLVQRGAVKPPAKKAGEFSIVSHEQAIRSLLEREVSADGAKEQSRVSEKMRSEFRARKALQDDLAKLKEQVKFKRECLKMSEERFQMWAAGEEPEREAEKVFGDAEQLSLEFGEKKRRERAEAGADE